ncbi:hypothetical protein Neut_1399 [Nitrosomonas eutropha C91]|uniref:Uncharacterized protein n=1 Tax=Nitrosomonas eutropha (strain DSM 101675 / C91 / Nm57) TaxID=335283 RepID=Q0AG85_NITEC|nr:hypothetical protein Neut_1399 [Nitrosomonas eutropha C91]
MCSFKLLTLDCQLVRGELGRLAVNAIIQATRSLYYLFGILQQCGKENLDVLIFGNLVFVLFHKKRSSNLLL